MRSAYNSFNIPTPTKTHSKHSITLTNTHQSYHFLSFYCLEYLGERVEERDDPGEDVAAIGDWGEDVEGVEEEGEDDIEEIPEDEGSDEPVVAGLHLEGAAVEQQNCQGERVACRYLW